MAQPLFAFLVEYGAASHKALVAIVKQRLFLRGQTAVVQMHVAHPLEQPGVEPHVVGVLCQDGLYLLGQCVHLVVGLGTEQVEEYRRHAAQQVVVALVFLGVDDGVVECWLLRVVDGLLNLLVVASDAFHESLLVVFQTDAVEGHRVVRRPIGLKKRVLMFVHCFAVSI